MRDLPSGRVPEQGPDWFLVATEACGGEISRLGEPRGAHEGGGRAQGAGAPPYLVATLLLP